MKTKTEQRRVGARGGRKSLFSCFHRADKFCPPIQDEPGHSSERKMSFSKDFLRFVTYLGLFVAPIYSGGTFDPSFESRNLESRKQKWKTRSEVKGRRAGRKNHLLKDSWRFLT